MPQHNVNAARIVYITGTVDPEKGTGAVRVDYAPGRVREDGSFQRLYPELLQSVSVPVQAGGVLTTGEAIVRAVADQEGLDLAAGDTVA